MKKIISIILLICLVVTMIPLQVFAEEEIVFVGEAVTSSTTTESAINTKQVEEEVGAGTEETVVEEIETETETGEVIEEITTEVTEEVIETEENTEEATEESIETPTGTIILRFLDEEGNEILDEDILGNMELGEYTFNAPILEGYIADFDSETVELTEDGEVIEIIFTYTFDSEFVEEPAQSNDITELNIIGLYCEDNDCETLFEYTENFIDETIITIDRNFNNLALKEVYDDGWDFNREDYFVFSNNNYFVEYIVNSFKPTTLTLFVEYTKPQLRLVLSDCQDMQELNEDEAIDTFIQRSFSNAHNILEERYIELQIGENFIEIPYFLNGLEKQFSGKIDWDSRIDIEFIEGENGVVTMVVNTPFLANLDYFVGYVNNQQHEEQAEVKPSKPKKEVKLEDIRQEDFVARFLHHKIINNKFIKATEKEIHFEVDKTLLNELISEDLTPRIYRYDKKKGKLIAEATKFNVKLGTDNIYTLTRGAEGLDESEKDEYYIIIGVKQPNFKDVEGFDYCIDKANGLGLVEGIETNGVLNFEAEKEISKSEYYTLLARIGGAMVEGETKLYDLLDLKSKEETDEILQGLKLETDEWAKPYIASLLEKEYITVEDLLENGNQITMESAMKTFNKLLSEVEDIENKETFTKNYEGENTRYKMVQTLVNRLVELGW